MISSPNCLLLRADAHATLHYTYRVPLRRLPLANAEHNRRVSTGSSRESDESVVKARIESLLPPIKKAIRVYLESKPELPIWQPPEAAPPTVVEHIRSLKIPALPGSTHIPSLLLHNLGNPPFDLNDRVKRLFDPNRNANT
jgi:hypothetical protein